MRSHRFCTWQGAPPVIDKIEAPSEREPAKVINLMDVLRRSVEAERSAGGKRIRPASCGQEEAAQVECATEEGRITSAAEC